MRKNGKLRGVISSIVGTGLIVLAAGCAETTKPDSGYTTSTPVDTTKGITQFTNTNPTAEQKTQAAAISNSSYLSLNNAMTSMSNDPQNFVEDGNFSSLRDSFKLALQLDPTNTQANIGYAMASLMTIQTSPDVKKAIDSLSGSVSTTPKTVSQMARIAFAKGTALPKTLASDPTVPSFLTYSYVQGVIESVVLPVLNDAIASVNRIQANADFTYTFNVDGEQVKIDAAEIYVFESVLRFTRASFGMMCAYNVDFYTSSNDRTYSWVDEVQAIEDIGWRNIYRLSNDTLYELSVSDDRKTEMYMFRLLKTNYERADFLTIRSPYHAQIKKDLIAIPEKLKAALQSVRAEQGVMSYDLWKPTDLEGMDEFFTDAESSLVEEGISAALASKFATPETFLTFVKEILSGPYTINEVVDGKPFVLKINLTGFFDNPVQDLRTLLPKFKWYPEAVWSKADNYNNDYGWTSSYGYNSITLWDNDTLIAPANRIDSIAPNGDFGTTYFFTTPYRTQMYADSSYYIEPVTLIRDDGSEFNMEDSEELPYFNDYTFAGTFPDMTTRAKWLTFIRQWEPTIH
ncbi:MAG: hypothetical protein JNL74_04155 [Fibrobacteres bacterium]|nr:hypothetical protein [Fibrobacterota bacterium]